jgi:ABC-type nitrate/sulfonate/bicarbonate transport system permease component
MVSVFLLADLYGAKASVGLALPLLIAADLMAYPAFIRHGSWKPVWRLLGPALVGLGIGWWMLGWIDDGTARRVIGACVLAFFPILTNTALGVKSIEEGHRDVMVSLNATRWQVFRRLELPSALPYIITGLEVGIVLAIIGAIVGEYLGGSSGLGHLLIARLNAFETDQMFAVLIHMSLLGFTFYFLIGALRRRLIPWHASARPRQ